VHLKYGYIEMNNIVSVNSLANNSDERVKKNSNPFSDSSRLKIRELEITVTNKCNLTCRGCGFDVPNQIAAVEGEGIDQHIKALKKLKSLGLSIGKVVLVGGEAALAKSLAEYIIQIRLVDIADQVELVTNGLYPQGVTTAVLNQLDSVVISDYICTVRFETHWRQYLEASGYSNKIDFRRKSAWDDLLSEVENDVSETEEHWKTCFYRNCDVTLERGRLFSCSRIAKKKWDEQGLLIESTTSLSAIDEYLNSTKPKQACYSCATVGSCSQIPVAEQVSTNLEKVVAKAEKYMDKVINHG
jgi:organic radical activating enzyme